MKLSRNRVRILIGLMVLALGGLVILQTRLFLNNLQLKQEAFRRNVISALGDAGAQLEEIDLRSRFFRVSSTPPPNTMVQTKAPHDTAHRFFFTNISGPLSTRIEGDLLRYSLTEPQSVTVRLYDEFGKLDTVLVEMARQEGTHVVRIPRERGVRIVQVRTDSATSVVRWEGAGSSGFSVDSNVDTLGTIVLRVAETFKAGSLPPLARRLVPRMVDSVLKTEFAKRNIDQPATYAVFSSPDDSLIFRRGEISEIRSDDFVASLFTNDFSGSGGKLVVRMPVSTPYFAELSLNLLFLAIVIGCFWYTVRALLRQHDFARRLTDFINNMTHEFKTPLSTIALASEALRRPDVLRSKTKMTRYNKIIGEEYARMRGQVDKILDMAALEEGEVEFHKEEIDLHAMIARMAEHVSLEVTARGGTLTSELQAQRHVAMVDAIHWENVLRSILDNAVKYSPGSPSIHVATANDRESLRISISDKGIGIPKDHLHKVFDKYYRVPTGNLHDVKGFGLGLSYARLVVKAHQGDVRLESENNEGTTVTIILPLEEHETQHPSA